MMIRLPSFTNQRPEKREKTFRPFFPWHKDACAETKRNVCCLLRNRYSNVQVLSYRYLTRSKYCLIKASKPASSIIPAKPVLRVFFCFCGTISLIRYLHVIRLHKRSMSFRHYGSINLTKSGCYSRLRISFRIVLCQKQYHVRVLRYSTLYVYHWAAVAVRFRTPPPARATDRPSPFFCSDLFRLTVKDTCPSVIYRTAIPTSLWASVAAFALNQRR